MVQKTTNELFPIFLKTNQLAVLLIGGSTVALEKLQAVLGNSPRAQVVVVAEQFSDAFVAFAEEQPTVELIEDRFKEEHLEGQQLVISAVNSEELSAEIREKVSERGILYNAADKPELCDFYLGLGSHERQPENRDFNQRKVTNHCQAFTRSIAGRLTE